MIAHISSGYGAVDRPCAGDIAASPSSVHIYIVPNDLIVLDPSVLDEITSDVLDLVIVDEYPIPLWPELYEEMPHRVPNHYPPAPRKMLPKRISGLCRKPLKLKQPVARSGFKRGQRR